MSTIENAKESGSGNIMGRGLSFLTKPITKLGHMMMDAIPEERNESELLAAQSPTDGQEPMTLEGTLLHRKSKAFGWKQRYVVLDLSQGGSISCFRLNKTQHTTKMLQKMYSKLHRRMGNGTFSIHPGADESLRLHIPTYVPWEVKDVVNDSSLFVVEIPTSERHFLHFDEDEHMDDISETGHSFATDPFLPMEEFSLMGESITTHLNVGGSLDKDLTKARQKHKSLRFYFKCPRKGNEKALWLRAFSKLGRLSFEQSNKRKFLGSLAQAVRANSRVRTPTSAEFARESRQLELSFSTLMSPSLDLSEVETISRRHRVDGKEFRVAPAYAYPHMWMTVSEMKDEMTLPSARFHDLRLPSKRDEEIGTLRVEVLQCLGIPKLNSEANAVVYLVCGSYAFATDVVPDCPNPMWLRKSRRACIFPLFHGYARLYVGVFDVDGKSAKDSLAGRIVLDIARLRPGSLYDVTIPLRLSTHVYSRRQRGSVRLRFQVDWNSERAALLSYLPKTLKIPRKLAPREDVTVMCSDETSFRNVAVTVHGAHLPGRFSYNQFRAVLREIGLTRKMVMLLLRHTIRHTVTWKNPAMSLFVFLAWMHCIYANQFSLVPAYFVSFVLLHMIRNYAKYGIDGPAQRGFVPPSWEEMCFAIICDTEGASYCISPMDLQQSRRIPRKTSSDFQTELDFTINEEEPDATVQTHIPKGKKLFQLLGFIDDPLDDTGEDTHLEFPFARGKEYPKLTVKESLDIRQPKKAKEPNEDKFHTITSPNKSETCSVMYGEPLESEDMTTTKMYPLDDDGNEPPEFDLNIPSSVEKAERDASVAHSIMLDNSAICDESDVLPSEVSTGDYTDAPLPPYMQMPEQNIDREGAKSGNSLTEDLTEIKEKMHELTFHLFNDKAYTIKTSEARYFGHGRKPTKRKTEYDVSRYLDKLLNVGPYSNGNPLIGRIAPYLEPVVGSALSFLCAFRALFNVFTWRDPFLSFWVSLLAGVVAVILFIFPWRMFLFLSGILIVGPQNWLLRLLRERGFFSGINRRLPTTDAVTTTEDLLHNQPVFQSHPPSNRRLKDVDAHDVNPKEVHHVVVPYTPLMYQRFYDWPPEPEYARVKKVEAKKPIMHNGVKRSGFHSRAHSSDAVASSSLDFSILSVGRNRSHSDGSPTSSHIESMSVDMSISATGRPRRYFEHFSLRNPVTARDKVHPEGHTELYVTRQGVALGSNHVSPEQPELAKKVQ